MDDFCKASVMWGAICREMAVLRILCYILLALQVATCGQKGPLYLPEDENPQSTQQGFQAVSPHTHTPQDA